MRLFRRKYGTAYNGPVAFVDGWHYPVKADHADTRYKLALVDDGYVYARNSDPTHLHVYATGEDKELVVE
jgi:hypothetical protein